MIIWCVEDDESIREIEIYTLKSTGFDSVGFGSGKELFNALSGDTRPDLLLLDIMLPDMDGTEILKRIKGNPDTKDIPVIMATAKGMEYDKIKNLDLGADDYLVKPFGMMEMVARVKAVLRRSGNAEKGTVLSAGKLSIDESRHTVYADGEKVELTLKEYEMLKLMMSHKGLVFTRDQLLSDIWGFDYDGETRTVDVHIRTLRSKLGKCGEYVMTVRGVGYKVDEQ